MSEYSELIFRAANGLQQKLPQPIECAVILGTGLGEIAQDVEVSSETSYRDIQGMTSPGAPGHQGKLTFCRIEGKQVALCHGRLHLYEGYSAAEVAMLVYILQQLGAKQLIVSNASGALNEHYSPGDIMVIHDHINFTGHNPIIGQDDSLGTRFADMSQAYSKDLSATAFQAASDLGLPIHLGVYAGVAGPSLETSSERRMLRQWGADAVGMSTVLEVIAAKHCGLDVLGLAAITNLALGDTDQQPDTIEDVMQHAAVAGKGIRKIIQSVLAS